MGEKVPLVQGDDSEQLDAVQKEGVRRMRAVRFPVRSRSAVPTLWSLLRTEVEERG